MIRQYKPLPPDMVLAPTLARRVNQLREFRNLTVRDLSKLSRFSIQRIEDVEAGLETWLSSTDRQLLAKSLAVEPYLLQEVETKPDLEPGQAQRSAADRLATSILQGARELECPNCGGILKCSVMQGLDLNEIPIYFPKAFCLKCPFVLKT